jgi:hypothetical protein
VLLKLIADFVAPLVAATLTLAAVFNSAGAILGQILPSSSGPTGVCPRAAGGCTYGGTTDSSRCELCPSALQEIGRRTTTSCRAGYARGAGRTRDVQEFINVPS